MNYIHHLGLSSHLPVLNTHLLLFHWKQGQGFALPLVDFPGAPALAGYKPGLTQSSTKP